MPKNERWLKSNRLRFIAVVILPTVLVSSKSLLLTLKGIIIARRFKGLELRYKSTF